MLLLSIPFPGISAVWVEISGRRGLESLPFPVKTTVWVEIPGITPHHGTPYHITPTARPTTARPTTSRPTTVRPTTASRTATVTHHVAVSLSISLLLLYFIREIIDFNEHQPRIKRG